MSGVLLRSGPLRVKDSKIALWGRGGGPEVSVQRFGLAVIWDAYRYCKRAGMRMSDVVVKYDAKEDAFAIRTKVFVEEQGYENEFDDIDDRAIHVVAAAGGVSAGCARCFVDEGDSSCYYIGRVAMLPEFRRRGIGGMLVRACEDAACWKGAHIIRLHAQARLELWYGSMGYVRFGEVDYEDEGQPHIWMEKSLERF